ncbi:hypothetical protein BDN71DRAFT_1457186 [Pleurotus eryngii]|uniref:Uncharacterized protein n=1 Tax=Pleurotus eryngii TaxID=5323 RepID=A0A9P5ZJL7_PLEER|nr:hypothetical protein BDN71DRAFT_1457186 [Pleurotus eryngii]
MLTIKLVIIVASGVGKTSLRGQSCSRRDYTRVTSWRTAAKTMPSTNEKGANLKISRTPKYAARPLAGIKGSGRNGFSPLPGEQRRDMPIAVAGVYGCSGEGLQWVQ